MTEQAALLLLCDNRAPWPTPEEIQSGATLSPDSVAALPLKRDRLRRYANLKHLSIVGEVIIELEKSVDMEFIVNGAVNQLGLIGSPKVLCEDRPGLEEAGIYEFLKRRLQEGGMTIVEPS